MRQRGSRDPRMVGSHGAERSVRPALACIGNSDSESMKVLVGCAKSSLLNHRGAIADPQRP